MKDNGRTIQIPLNTPFEIELEGNPTTGYQWQAALYDSTVIKSLGEPKYQSEAKVPGEGGIYTFKFQSVNSGETDLKLVYRRPFEPDAEPVRTFTLHVISGTIGRITAE